MRILVAAFVACSVGLASFACAHAAPGGEPPLVAAVSGPQPEPGAVDLNQATESDLIALPHIGPAKAAAIVAYRKKHGAFARVADLRKVRGFGRKTVADLLPMVTVGKPTSLATTSPPPGAAPSR
jgi:competence protein ComEA